jgi:hypothetical protein
MRILKLELMLFACKGRRTEYKNITRRRKNFVWCFFLALSMLMHGQASRMLFLYDDPVSSLDDIYFYYCGFYFAAYDDNMKSKKGLLIQRITSAIFNII